MRIIIIMVFFSLLILSSEPINAKKLVFGLVVKNTTDTNFINAFHGCQEEAEQQGNSCELLGSDTFQPRLQLDALQHALSNGRYDALAVSAIKSDYITALLHRTDIPVITFDSPLMVDDQWGEQFFIGMDNEVLGELMAKEALRMYPDGGQLCLMTASSSPNLSQRVYGVRKILSGMDDFPVGQRLAGEGGWIESPRCPWNSGESTERAIRQLMMTLGVVKPDVLISVGDWIIQDDAAFRHALTLFPLQDVQIILGAGQMTEAMKSYLAEHLVDAILSVDFAEMGRLCAVYMQEVSLQRMSNQTIYLPIQVYRADASATP